MRLAILLLAPALAQAQTSGEVGVGPGVFAGQLGGGVTAGVEHRSDGLRVLGEGTVAVRSLSPYSALDRDPSVVAGLGSVGAGWTFATGDQSRVGPVAHLDFAVLPWWERDCFMGNGCRHWNWIGNDRQSGFGVSLQPAIGVRWEFEGRKGARTDLNVSSQPTNLYDVAIPFAPRIDLGWTSASGWGLAYKAYRYGFVFGFTRRI